ncbi:hypothetical protein KKD19_05980 [Patescibacteria group bacterium]|nr:hypothetical protein [Patescibacteria group bacterium]MBU4512752.1 hypothetical protein [Patescibacteria group bacterium]MCG2693092.1 hypothetical protein [Candidatus Parcubacteria bacterium]
MSKHPYWVCQECGSEASEGRQFEVSCWHPGTCDICGKEKEVTEFRDFFYGNPPKEAKKDIEV